MTAETLVVPRAELDIEDLWVTPRACTPVRLRRAGDGAAPRLATSVAAWYDDDYLSILFCATDDHIEAMHLVHDAPLYEEDVVEVFIATDALTRYFELEANPRGTVFDARIESPNGDRATMRVDRDWTCEGLFTAVRKVTESDGSISLDTILRIPFFALERETPGEGETWRANFFRVDRHPRHGDEYSAWQPTYRIPADFHVPSAFGTLRFA